MRTVNLAAIHHINWLEYRHTLPDGRVCIRLRTARGDWERVLLHIADMYGPGAPTKRTEAVPMACRFQDDQFDYYEAVVRRTDPRNSYYFSLSQGGLTVLLDEDGIKSPGEAIQCFPYNYAYPAEKKPDWACGAVGYQVFPDRFRRAGKHEKGLEKWGSKRVQNHYRFGGNLRGIREAVPYLQELGVGILYMTPIFVSDTSHRYNTFDYYTIDPLLGSEEDLRDLVQALHAAGIRILLDGVFNHSGTAFAPFMDAKENGRESAYYDWFHFHPDGQGYRCFAHEPSMPKLNLQTPAAQAYFCDVGRYWIERCGIDGWRLDVSPEVWPDFWRMFRRVVKAANPDAILVAECWDDSREWITPGDMFDSTMHYVLSRAMWGFFAEKTLSLSQFDSRINRAMMLYPLQNQAVLWNFLGSHDTMRMLTRCGENETAMRAAVFFQMTHPGVPIVYYGDELGMTGGDDPYCRHSMRWDWVEGNAMLAYYRRLIALRNESAALRHGSFRTWHVDAENGVYAYLRETDEEMALCVLATGEKATEALVPLPEGWRGESSLLDQVSGEACAVVAGQVKLTMLPGHGFVFGG
ncbi:MAG: glycoside hydrolase family 13 protein [Oscillospiraceae bacterium]|jgi:glycosidase|nr:glycoside hydrolase family 13 protein [Oscillospiraceae bacterium]